MITKLAHPRWICFLILLFVGEVFCQSQAVVYEQAQRSSSPCLSESTVCADVYSFTKTVNGKRQKTERRVINCLCQGGQCPNSTNHIIYDTSKHKLQLCQPIASLTECRPNQTAHEVHLQDKKFDLFSYTTVKCLCPHHLESLPGPFNRSVKYGNTHFVTNHVVHHYTCNIPGNGN
ncbi:uncharacterized protein LOC106877028 [Octopus bimaculoides]|uniref:Uncharacterized protein n=1 Tax=Octopus bimaculoides TaxID=37653 RepID=A0A0L8GGM5_OCTBM|nr:uncharacterized protein LOC106877028 [Octopus bimaculoides]|eukprot:XP_014781295.1 PREDICTED: uncharacterized protein LOC106877028 [Octopus bimaculoides]